MAKERVKVAACFLLEKFSSGGVLKTEAFLNDFAEASELSYGNFGMASLRIAIGRIVTILSEVPSGFNESEIKLIVKYMITEVIDGMSIEVKSKK